jgi:hypothetical protein
MLWAGSVALNALLVTATELSWDTEELEVVW